MNSSTSLPQGACAMVFRDGLLLAVGRRGHALDRVGFPGGKLDPGENHKTAAARELFEETGLATPADSLIAIYTGVCEADGISGRDYWVPCYLVPLPLISEPRSIEPGILVGWMTPEEFLSKSSFPLYNQAVLRAFFARANPMSD